MRDHLARKSSGPARPCLRVPQFQWPARSPRTHRPDRRTHRVQDPPDRKAQEPRPQDSWWPPGLPGPQGPSEVPPDLKARKDPKAFQAKTYGPPEDRLAIQAARPRRWPPWTPRAQGPSGPAGPQGPQGPSSGPQGPARPWPSGPGGPTGVRGAIGPQGHEDPEGRQDPGGPQYYPDRKAQRPLWKSNPPKEPKDLRR